MDDLIDLVRGVIDTGQPVEVVARRTVEAIRANQLWVFPHPDAQAMVQPRLDALTGIGNRLAVEGHADPGAVQQGGAYVSNWELSLARALAVADVLVSTGLDRPVTCYGLADSRYDELGEIAESDRRVVARRVDLVFYASAEDER